MATPPRLGLALVPLVRKPRQPLSGDRARRASAGFLCVPLGVLRGPAALHPRHDALHRGDRRVRGAALRHARPHRGLARGRRALAVVGPAWRHAVRARRHPHRQRGAGRAADDPEAPDARRELPDAAALEFPSADARPEHDLLPGRVRRPRRDQGDADGARGARRVVHGRGHPGLHGHLLRHDGAGGRPLRLLAARTVPRVDDALRRGARLLRAAARQGRSGAGGRPLADDRARHRRVHEHRDREAVLACESRGRLRALRDEGVHDHRARADAAREPVRDRRTRHSAWC